MRNLKTYTRFLESNSDHTSEIMGVLNNMCLELSDKGFSTQVDFKWGEGSINVYINYDEEVFKKFHFNDIKYTLLDIIHYMKKEGWSVNGVYFIDGFNGKSNGVLKNGELFYDTETTWKVDVETKIDWLISNFKIKFIESWRKVEFSSVID